MTDIDVLIVAALRMEFDAARDAGLACAGGPGVSAWEKHDIETPPYYAGTYVGADGRRMRVALARSTRTGATSTSPLVAALAARLRPGCLAMCGVCAGNPGEVSLGDVIIAEMAYQYDEGKRGDEGFELDLRPIPMADDWVRVAQDMLPDALPSFGEASLEDAERWLLERLMLREDPAHHPARARYLPAARWRPVIEDLQRRDIVRREGMTLHLTAAGLERAQADRFYNPSPPKVLPFAIHTGPMARGNAVVKDGVSWSDLQRHGVRKVLGLEMEAATIATAAHKLGIPLSLPEIRPPRSR
jgi:nucleoside phosphorylase